MQYRATNFGNLPGTTGLTDVTFITAAACQYFVENLTFAARLAGRGLTLGFERVSLPEWPIGK
jgi:hypothetical protein